MQQRSKIQTQNKAQNKSQTLVKSNFQYHNIN